MNEMPNAPMLEPSAPPSMFQTWINAVTKPNERTFAAIASAPNAGLGTAVLWVLIGSLISSFLSILAPNTGLQDLQRLLQQQGLGNALGNTLSPSAGGFGAKAFQVICGAPVGAIFAVIFFVIGVALIQWVARMFGGHGTLDKLAFTFAAITAPLSIITGLLALLGAIPYVGLCFGILGAAVGIYAVVLEVMATKAVNGFTGWGPAIGSVLIPGVVIFLVCCCVFVGIFALVGASLGNVLSSMGPLPFPTP